MAVEIPVVIDIDKAFQDAAKRVGVAMEPLRKSVDNLTEDLSTWTSIMRESDVNSDDWIIAAKNIQSISEALSKADYALRRYTSNEGSIRQMSTDLAELNRRWEAMGTSQKFGPDGKTLSADAQKAVAQYKEITAELNRQGKTLQQIIAEENRIEQLKQRGIQSRRYENAILNTTVKSIRVLEERERILSDRLAQARIGSNKYKQLKADLEGVRQELEQINGRVQSTIPSLGAVNSSLANLVKRSLQLVAIHTGTRFIKNIREVTAEFELQRVALGGIIQDTERANVLFRQIKAAAIESPFEIKDLVTYTKQLSAYRIETDNLFKVTMQLADVSAGLGVDMNRLILAYGQVRAASVLRGQELRQFTEAGIPLVEKLAKKFSELRGTMVSTSEVFELISKRAVPFEMVAEIFDDMTERGGEFYKMQEKQAATLAGQWANLKDSLSIMYDEMGNTDVVHSAMEALIGDAKVIFQNWHLIASAIKAAVVQFGLYKIASLWLPNLRRELGLAKKAQDALTKSQELSKYALESGSKTASVSAARMRLYATYMRQASMETNFLKRSVLQLKAAFAGLNWISAVITALSTLGTVIYSIAQESGRLNKELNKIKSEGDLNINRSVANFERLAEQAAHAADGSKEQAKAVAELKRTYGDLIPSEQLQAKALSDLQGNYESLTRAIREKINEQIREQQINTITDEYSKKITRKQTKTRNYLASYGLDREQVNAVMAEIQEAIDKGLLTVESSLSERRATFEKIIKELTGVVVDFSEKGKYTSDSAAFNNISVAESSLNDLLNVYLKMDEAVDSVNNSMSTSIGTYGKFADMSKKLEKSLSDVFVDTEKFGKRGTYSNNQEKIRQSVEIYWDYLEQAFAEVNKERSDKIDISKALLGDGKIDFNVINEAVKEAMAGGQNTRLNAFVSSIKEGYEKLVPSDRIVNLVRTQVSEIAEQYGVSMNIAQTYFKDSETSMEDWVKSLQDAAKTHKSILQQMEDNNKKLSEGAYGWKEYTEEEIKAEKSTNQFLDALIKLFDYYAKHTKGGKGAYTQDPFIAQMKERIKFMQDFKRGYDELNKYLSSQTALSEQDSIMRSRGLSLGLSPEEQMKAAKNLSTWYQEAMEKAFSEAKRFGASGSVESFLSQQIDDTSNRGKALKDFQALIQSLWDAKTDFDISQKKKDLEDALKKLSDEIKRSETARNFYNDILDLTGDEQLAATLGVSIYGDVGSEFKDRLQAELNKAMETVDASAMTDELHQAFSTQNFSVILANLDKFPEEWQKRLKEMAASSEKFQADRAKELLKSLEKFKSYGERQVELSKQTARRTADIQAMEIPDSMKQSLLEQNTRKQAEESAKIAYEAFRDTPMYIELFDDLDAASGRMLENMRKNLEDMRENWKALSPRELKELQSKINDLDEQIARKNPFKALVASIKEYRDLQKETPRSEAENAAITANDRMIYEKEILALYQKQYDEAVANYDEVKQAKENLEVQSTITDLAIEEAKAAQKTASKFKEAGTHIQKAAEKMQDWAGYVSDSLDGIGQIVSTFASDDVSETFDIIAEGIGKTVGGASEMAMGLGKILTGTDVAGGVVNLIKGTGDFIAGTFGTKSQLSIKAINKKIDEQDRLLSQLSYSYGRLEAAMAKAFGSDYIYNYTEQLKNLQAQQAAYEEQARLESQKGKKKDQQKIEEYAQSAKEVEDQILEMRGKLAEFFAGSDLTSAAEDFANAWIEAYMEFGSTTDAISEKFKDMVNNMIVKSLAGKAMQNLLKPVFDEIDSLAIDGELTAAEIGRISAMATAAIPQINDAMTGLMNNLTTAGIDLRTHAGQFTGISRDIVGASEESILGLAAAVNTANFYISHVPAIAENVAAIRGALVGDTPTNVRTTASEGPTYEDQMLGLVGSIPQMRDDMAAMRSMLERVIKPVGVSATHYVAVR